MEQRKDRRRPLCLLTRMTVFRLLCLNSLTYHGIHSPFKGRSSGGGSGSNTRSSSGSGRSSSGSQGGVMAAAIPEGAPGWREPPRMSASTIKVSNVSGARKKSRPAHPTGALQQGEVYLSDLREEDFAASYSTAAWAGDMQTGDALFDHAESTSSDETAYHAIPDTSAAEAERRRRSSMRARSLDTIPELSTDELRPKKQSGETNLPSQTPPSSIVNDAPLAPHSILPDFVGMGTRRKKRKSTSGTSAKDARREIRDDGDADAGARGETHKETSPGSEEILTDAKGSADFPLVGMENMASIGDHQQLQEIANSNAYDPDQESIELELLTAPLDQQLLTECLHTVYRIGAVAATGMGMAFLSTKSAGGANDRLTNLQTSLLSTSAFSHLSFNRKYQQTLAIEVAALFPSILIAKVVFDFKPRTIETSLNVPGFVKVFFAAFTTGYAVVFATQVIVATVTRTAVLQVLEPELVAMLTHAPMGPGVPLTSLSWVLKDHGFRAQPLTTFISEFLVDCVTSPLIEESVKLWIVLRCAVLPQRYSELARFTHVHSYLGYLMAAAMGLKAADNLRRVCLYTHRLGHHHKIFFAFMRGLFPVHELCALLTALQIANRDILGKQVPLAWVVGPAAALHAMGNFRGKKPIFKWACSHPWVEMQLHSLNIPEDAPALQIAMKISAGCFWLIFLAKVGAYLLRSYHRIEKVQAHRLERYFEQVEQQPPPLPPPGTQAGYTLDGMPQLQANSNGHPSSIQSAQEIRQLQRMREKEKEQQRQRRPLPFDEDESNLMVPPDI